MSGTLPAHAPAALPVSSPAIEQVIDARPREVDGMAVRRLLPSAQRRLVGPFIFFDHFGPAQLPAGTGFDVRPHPHIGLATVTFLFEGEILHRDSLGNLQPIVPGDVNLMSAGRGIVHSERSPQAARAAGPRLHGIQSWMALPLSDEESEPRFEHHPANHLPHLGEVSAGAAVDVILGSAYGVRAPPSVASPTLYAHVRLAAGSRLPVDGTHEERAFYLAEGALLCDGQRFDVGALVVLRPGAAVEIIGATACRLLLLGGAKLAGPRFVDWNFVSSARERLQRAKDDWRAGRFPKVPGDEDEFIPLPPDR
jgi:redox-sensitive bicupin YhaK (pirin superfamily)